MTKLQSSKGDNKYCGPAVLSILTGKSTDECASILGAIQGRHNVREVSLDDMAKACKKLRFNVTLVPNTENSSLFYSFHTLYQYPGMYVVAVKKHVVAVEVTEDKEIYLCDNHTKEPINAGISARLGMKCLGIYKVTAKDPAVLISEKLKIKATNYGYYFSKTKIFEDSDDNIEMNLGYLNITDSDIALIVNELSKFNDVDNQQV